MGGSGDPAETNIIAAYLDSPISHNMIDLNNILVTFIFLWGGAVSGPPPPPPPHKNVTDTCKYLFKSGRLSRHYS